MKKYSIQNYIRWKLDLSMALKMLPNLPYEELSRDQLITKFLPLVESLARKFSTAQQASGVMSIMDLIQEGNYGLCAGVDRINWDTILESKDKEKITIKWLADLLKVTPRTIHRKLCKELKQVKQELNEEIDI